ncbi:nucleoside diphosphate kinase homolog 5 isoform X1 [Chiloscyllium plagiosum]|uniref:nucleoside diphosphate kinase homolog 5 isoform X1 n=1 Tax=Chiloscyllium plagiosum TaxID=36176 RepID=UPI001CB7B7C8|nr:nucleoside diphosphate kinase homolog 5 isoform X1 [Chiloscyllium plagiosum]
MDGVQAATAIHVESTLALIKPDAIENANEIEDIILRSGFTILQKRKVYLSPELCSDIYATHYGKIFFPSLTAFMSSGPIIAMVIARNQAVAYWRELIGPANSVKAKETHPGSIRAIYGTDHLRNAVHGSETSSAAKREIQLIFPYSKSLICPSLFNNPTTSHMVFGRQRTFVIAGHLSTNHSASLVITTLPLLFVSTLLEPTATQTEFAIGVKSHAFKKFNHLCKFLV